MLSKSHLKKITALKNKKFRDQKKQFLIEGLRNCLEAIQSDFIVETLLFNPENDSQNLNELIKLALKKNIELVKITESDIKGLADTVHSQEIFCVVQKKQFSTDSILKKKNEYLRVLGTKTDQNLEQINTLFLRVV